MEQANETDLCRNCLKAGKSPGGAAFAPHRTEHEQMKSAGDAIALAESYYRAAGRTSRDMERDGRLMDILVCTPHLVLMARLADSSAPASCVVDISRRFPRERCDAWHLHFISGQADRLLTHERIILSQPWILTQHGKRRDGRLVRLSSSRFCRLLRALRADCRQSGKRMIDGLSL